jgi:hypothetical protein
MAIEDEEEMVELVEEALLEMFIKSPSSTAATPATSATSSPSLPPSTPPPNDIRFIFERLNANIDDDYNDNEPGGTTSTATTITVSTLTSSATTNVNAKAAVAAAVSNANLVNDKYNTNSLWNIPASKKSLRTRNPIRAIVDPIMAAAASSAAKVASSGTSDNNDHGGGEDQISLAVSLLSISS